MRRSHISRPLKKLLAVALVLSMSLVMINCSGGDEEPDSSNIDTNLNRILAKVTNAAGKAQNDVANGGLDGQGLFQLLVNYKTEYDSAKKGSQLTDPNVDAYFYWYVQDEVIKRLPMIKSLPVALQAQALKEVVLAARDFYHKFPLAAVQRFQQATDTAKTRTQAQGAMDRLGLNLPERDPFGVNNNQTQTSSLSGSTTRTTLGATSEPTPTPASQNTQTGLGLGNLDLIQQAATGGTDLGATADAVMKRRGLYNGGAQPTSHPEILKLGKSKALQ